MRSDTGTASTVVAEPLHVHQLSRPGAKIALKDKIDESREFAADVDAGLYRWPQERQSGNEGSRREEGPVRRTDRRADAVYPR